MTTLRNRFRTYIEAATPTTGSFDAEVRERHLYAALVKPPCPDVVRKGALVRVGGGQDDVGCEVLALAFLDLRFADGHVERWLGPGSIGALSGEPDRMTFLQLWATSAADKFAFDIACDVARDFDTAKPPAVDHLPCEEVVIEWNQPPID